MIVGLHAATSLADSIRARVPALDRAWVTGLFALAVALLTWDPQPITPAPGLDPSWTLGLSLVAAEGLDHGTEVVFTYGPLGFLELPQVADGLLAALSGVYLLATRVLLAASVLRAARRSLPWVIAALLAICVMAIAPRATGSVPLALATVWCLVALQWPTVWTRRLLIFGGGALAAIEVLVKLNTGAAILLLVAISAAVVPGRRVRGVAALLGTFAGVFALLWLLAGQSIGAVDDYLRSATLVLSGYSEAMQVEDPVVAWDWAAALLTGAATVAAAAYAGASLGLGAAQRLAMVAVVAIVAFTLWKFGFVRHDAGHVGAYFEGLLVIWPALAWRGQSRVVPLAATVVLAVVYAVAAGRAADFTIRPATAIEQLGTLVSSADERDLARAKMQLAYGVDPRIVQRIGGEPMDVRPWEIGLAWAYGFNWDPLPVLQDYAAYDPELDQLNADRLASDRAPRYILRHLGYGDSAAVGIDGRFTTFDSPRATLEVLCRYRAEITTERHQLLERTDTDRCGEPRPLGRVEAEFGERVTVPRAGPGEAVIARIHGADAQGVERLRALLYRAAQRRIEIGEASANFPPRNADGGLLLRVPPGADFPPPFALAPNVDTIEIESDGGLAASDGTYVIEFEAVPVRTR